MPGFFHELWGVATVAEAMKVPVLVIGGGIGGLGAARALSLKGHRVHVIEQAAEFAELGAGLQLAPNAWRCLDRLQVMEQVRLDAVFPRQLLMMDALSGEPILSVALGEAFRSRYGYPYGVMHRSDLHAHLLRACRDSPLVTLETGRAVAAVTQGVGMATATCRDGSTYEAEVLIGADGLRSRVRHALGDAAPPVCEEYVAFRGAVPIERITRAAGPDSMVGWCGPEMHLIQYPVRRGELFNQVAVFRSPSFKPDSDDWGTPAELEAKFAPMHPLVRGALQTIGRDRRWTMYDRPPTHEWVSGRTALLGDAAHPMLQYLAQGACQALEDGVCLAEMLARHDDVDRALQAYQRARAAHAARVQLTARFFGDIVHSSDTAALLRNAAFRGHDPADYRMFDWLYGHDPLDAEPEEDARVAAWMLSRKSGSPAATSYPG